MITARRGEIMAICVCGHFEIAVGRRTSIWQASATYWVTVRVPV